MLKPIKKKKNIVDRLYSKVFKYKSYKNLNLKFFQYTNFKTLSFKNDKSLEQKMFLLENKLNNFKIKSSFNFVNTNLPSLSDKELKSQCKFIRKKLKWVSLYFDYQINNWVNNYNNDESYTIILNFFTFNFITYLNLFKSISLTENNNINIINNNKVNLYFINYYKLIEKLYFYLGSVCIIYFKEFIRLYFDFTFIDYRFKFKANIDCITSIKNDRFTINGSYKLALYKFRDNINASEN